MLNRVHEGTSCSPNVSVNIWWVFHHRWMTMLYTQPGLGREGAWQRTLAECKEHWKETLLGLIGYELKRSWNDLLGLYSNPDASCGCCIVGREVQRELNVDNVVYLNTSVWVGGLNVIHTRTALFILPSSSSSILRLPLSLFRIPSLLVLPFPTFPFLLNAHHCLTVLQPHPISLFAASSVVLSSLVFSNAHTHKYAWTLTHLSAWRRLLYPLFQLLHQLIRVSRLCVLWLLAGVAS